VQQAHQVAPLKNNCQELTGDIYNDYFEFVWQSPASSEQGADGKAVSMVTLGYNNLGQALDKAQQILDKSDRAAEGASQATQKILVLTKGKRVECTIAKEVASKIKSKKILIDVVLMSAEYESNPGPYQILKEIVSYPAHAHFHVIHGLHTLVSWASTSEAVSRIIPMTCPDAVSPKQAIKKQCDQKAIMLHKGRECGDWTHPLSTKVVPTVQDCANLALQKGFAAFIYTDIESPAFQSKEGSTTANCMTHKTDGKLPAYDPQTMKPYDDTCKFVPEYGQKEPKSFTGWSKQPFAAGNGMVTSHYAVVDGSGGCPKSWDYKYKKQAFAPGFNELEYIETSPEAATGSDTGSDAGSAAAES